MFSPSAFQYNQLTVTNGFLKGANFSYSGYARLDNDAGSPISWPDNLFLLRDHLKEYSDHTDYERLTALECRRAYAQSFVRDGSDVIVVATTKIIDNSSGQILGASTGGSGSWPYKWLCPSDSAMNFKCYDQIRKPSQLWTFGKSASFNIDYCLSKKMTAQCKLEYGVLITSMTIAANFLKVLCFIVTLRMVKAHTRGHASIEDDRVKHSKRLLITTGDAVASFLEFLDKSTISMSTVEKQDFRNGIWALRWMSVAPMVWRPRSSCSWFRAIGLRRWTMGMLPLVVLGLAQSIFLFTKATWLTQEIGVTPATIYEMGRGKPNGLFLLGSRASDHQLLNWKLLENIALANSPQLAISVAYYIWNNGLVTMITAREYNMYAAPHVDCVTGSSAKHHRHPLRVTNRQQQTEQKPPRFFEMPASYWATNSVFWILLHYLASQAIFFARVDVLNHWLEVTEWGISQTGYSILGLLYFILCAYLVLFYALGTSLRRLPNRMPLATTCSGAISAACHPRDGQVKHHQKRVHWGAEGSPALSSAGDTDQTKLANCTSTSEEAYYPVAHKFYA